VESSHVNEIYIVIGGSDWREC